MTQTSHEYATLLSITGFIQDRIQAFVPDVAIILGTGLGALAQEVEVKYTLNYDEIPGFPVSTVESHYGKLLFGELAGRKVMVMQGRFHYYEGYTMQQVVMPVRVAKMLGVKHLLISNAAGGLQPAFETSDLMLITDHINLQPTNPLIGRNIPELGSRFPDMFHTYSPDLIEIAQQVAANCKINLKQGVYASLPGPMLETPAEYRYLQLIGADAVGMSTVPEVIAAKHMELPVLALSVITDMCVTGRLKPVQIVEILEAAAKAEPQMTLLFKEIIKQLPPRAA